MGRIVFRFSLLFVVLVATAAKDIPVSPSYIIKHTDSCPDVGYYFRREPAANSIDPAPCLLCFCRDNETAACWARESKRCDVEKYHHHNMVGRDLSRDSPRVRRSPVSLSDIFFRDATRDFFDKNLPEECKPFEESFSDGCPPADWCIGCTICDCDANGRWDCHILSFCNNEEKKKIDGVKIPPPKSKRIGKKNGGTRRFTKPKTTNRTTRKPPKKTTPKRGKKPTKPAKKAVKKEVKVIRRVKNDTKTQNMKRRKIIIKRKADNQKIKQKRDNPDQTRKDIVIKKGITNHKPTNKPVTITNTIVKGSPFNNTNNEYVLGQMLVKRVMSSVQRLVQTEIDKLNKTMEKMQEGSDCEGIQKRNKKRMHPSEYKPHKIGEEFRWMRNKRDIFKQTPTSYYDNGIKTTTDNIDVIGILTNHSNSSNWINETNLLSVPLNISQNNNEVDLKDIDIISYVVAPYVQNNTKGNNTVLDEKKEINIKLSVEKTTAINKINHLSVPVNITQKNNEVDFKDVDVINYVVAPYVQNKTNGNNTVLDEKKERNINLSVEKTTTINKIIHLSVPVNISQKNNEVDFNLINYVVVPHPYVQNKTNGNINILDEKKEKKNDTNLSVEKINNINTINNSYKTTQKINTIIDYIPEFYNVNSNEISMVKSYKYEMDHIPTEKYKLITNTNTTTNVPVRERTKSYFYRKQTIRAGVTKKYNLKKVIKKNFKDLVSNYFPIDGKQPIQKHILMRNKKISKTNFTQNLKSKLNFMKYIKKIFNKIFFGKKKKYLQQKDDECQILRILCENISDCNINGKNRNLLKNKIRKLNAEANSIFKTIKIIKGLLHLIDIPNYTNSSNLKNDIGKLNIILRETNENFSKNISDTQKIQIEYIKRNTKMFTESVGRFTELLNDVIFILQKNGQETPQRYYYRFANKNIKESFDKIRKLLLKHNLVENRFIKNIYNMINDLENKVKSNKSQVSEKRKNNKVIDSYSRNIIENLRKLKGLAQALNSSRRKREVIRDDDTMEYLLLLMEYLIKKEHPAPKEPVNDGIDLLIDTIKSAPDIKSIKKKVLQNLPTSVDSITANSVDKDNELKDSISDTSSAMSKESNVSTIEDIDSVNRAMIHDEDLIANASINVTEHDFFDNVTQVPVLSEDKQEKSGFRKFENVNEVFKKYEPFVEDDDIYPAVVNSSAYKETTVLPEPYYEFQDTTSKTKENYSADTTGNLEWIEENFGNEVREIKHNIAGDNKSETTTAIAVINVSKEPPEMNIDNNTSNVSVEDNKVKKKMSAEEVMYRKQMDLLNSLDYGTPKSDFEDTKSEDDEKYTVDTYF